MTELYPRDAANVDPLQLMLAEERVEALVSTLTLYPQGAALVLLQMEHGYSLKELAEQRGVAAPTIGAMIQRLAELVLRKHPEYRLHAIQGDRNRGAGKHQRQRRAANL